MSENPSFYRTFYNYTMIRKKYDEEKVLKDIEEARKRGVPVSIATFDNEHVQKLSKLGFYSLKDVAPHMMMDIPKNQTGKSCPEGFEIGEIQSNKDVHFIEWFDVLRSAMSMNAEAIQNVISNAPCGPKEPLRHFYILDKSKNKVVSIGTIFFDENVCGVYNMATYTEYRGKGFAKRILEKMILDIARDEKHYRYSILQSAPKAIPLYQSFGFHITEMLSFNFRLEQADLIPRLIGTPAMFLITNVEKIKTIGIVLAVVLFSWVILKLKGRFW
eukprot:gene10835-3455_t